MRSAAFDRRECRLKHETLLDSIFRVPRVLFRALTYTWSFSGITRSQPSVDQADAIQQRYSRRSFVTTQA
jgi:hypothetical protein